MPVAFTLNGKTVEARSDETLLQTAKRNENKMHQHVKRGYDRMPRDEWWWASF